MYTYVRKVLHHFDERDDERTFEIQTTFVKPLDISSKPIRHNLHKHWHFGVGPDIDWCSNMKTCFVVPSTFAVS